MPNTEFPLPDWNRAFGFPFFDGVIKQSCSDFKVDEIVSFKFSDDGEHDWLRIRKTDANTGWVAKVFAKYAGVPVRDVGYSGLKDRRAIATQWFSVRRPSAKGTPWERLEVQGIEILEQRRHRTKLRRGAHRGNRFRIVIRAGASDTLQLYERIDRIRVSGVPNYFGSQRFGHNGGNLVLANDIFNERRLARDKRSIALSAARSFLFNEILSTRVAACSWSHLLNGEPVNLDGSGSHFIPEKIDADLLTRLSVFDVHPTGALWGKGVPFGSEEFVALESAVCNTHPTFCTGLVEQGVAMGRRPLRMNVKNLHLEVSNQALTLRFELGRGQYATSVLRELMDVIDG